MDTAVPLFARKGDILPEAMRLDRKTVVVRTVQRNRQLFPERTAGDQRSTVRPPLPLVKPFFPQGAHQSAK